MLIAGDGGNDEGIYQKYVDSSLNSTWGGCITDDSNNTVTVRSHRGIMSDSIDADPVPLA